MSERGTPTLRIAWLILWPIIGSGGFHNIFRTINLLASFGHENILYLHPHGLPPEDRDRPGLFIQRHFGPLFAHVQPWPEVIDEVDVALATQWSSFELLDRCAPGVAKAYFVQDYEPFFMPMSYAYLQAEATYRAGVPCITLGHWLATFLKEKYGAETYPFDFGVDHHLYYPRPELRPDRPRILFYARPSTPRRCFELGVDALARVHERHPEAEIVLFGDHDLSRHSVPFPFRDEGILDHGRLAELYASATVGLVLSSTNPSLMPLEMMASECAVVDLDLPPNHFLLQHEETALLAPPTPEGLADAVCRLLEEEALRSRIVAQARAYALQHNWERSARQIEAALLEIVGTPGSWQRSYRVDLEHRSGDGLTPPLNPQLVVGQRFIPRHDGLNRIAVAAVGEGSPRLRLYLGVEPGTPVVEAEPTGREGEWLLYDFGPLAGSRLQPCYFTLSADWGPQLRFDYRPSGEGSLAYNHVPQTGRLVFRTFYDPRAEAAGPERDPLREELAYLQACQGLAAAEGALLARHAQALQEAQTVARSGWAERLGRALGLLLRGQLRTLWGEVRAFLRWKAGGKG